MRNILAAAALVTAGLTGSAGAAVVTWDFMASGFCCQPQALLDRIGSNPVTGSFTYDDAVPFIFSAGDNGEGPFAEAFYSASVTLRIGSKTYVSGANVIACYIASVVDYLGTSSSWRLATGFFAEPDGTAAPIAFGVILQSTGTEPSGTNWSNLKPTLAQLNAGQRYATFNAFPDFPTTSNVTFSAPAEAPVPLPAGGVLLLSVIAGLALKSRRRA